MSEQEITQGEVTELQVTEVAKPSRADHEALQKEMAAKNGWEDFDDYVAGGGDPAKWKTADAFNLFGELRASYHKKEQEFERRLEGVHKLTQAQLAAQRESLLQDRDKAIEAGDKQAVRALDNQIGNLNQPLVQTDFTLDRWNSENPWIYDDTPKADRAKATFGKAVAAGKSIAEAVQLVEQDIKKHFTPPEKPAHIPDSEKGRGSAGFGKKTSPLTMADLSREEQMAYKALPGAWKSEKEFLQAVADDRKAAARG